MWIIYALIGMLTMSCITLMIKGAMDMKVPVAMILVYLSGTSIWFAIGYSMFKGYSFSVGWKPAIILMLAAVLGFIGNLFAIRALGDAPNPAYASAIASVNVAVVAVMSVFLFKSELNVIKVLGIFLCIAGVVLLSIKTKGKDNAQQTPGTYSRKATHALPGTAQD